MEQFDRFFKQAAPVVLSLLRIVAAGMFMVHGTQKLFGLPPSDHGAAALFSLVGLAGVLEFGGGLLLMLGLFTRPVAFILSGQMAVAYFMAHAPRELFPVWNLLPNVNRGELAVLYCFVFLYFWAAGAGPWSLDALWQRLRATRTAERREAPV